MRTVEMALSEIDLRRMKSALVDYQKAVRKMLPAETTIPAEVGDFVQRIDNALSYINEDASREQPTVV